MMHAVARVANPYGPSDDAQRPPLAVGMFVEAEIEGHVYEEVYLLPRSALRQADGNDRVYASHHRVETGRWVGPRPAPRD